jgi:hypothetical protein
MTSNEVLSEIIDVDISKKNTDEPCPQCLQDQSHFKVKIDSGGVDEIEANAMYQGIQVTDAFCANLQVVKIDDIGWLPNEMSFIELVLFKAKVLLTMHLRLGCFSSKSNEDALQVS